MSLKLYSRFREFGGLKLIREYTRMGLLSLIFKQAVAVVFRKKKPIEAYSRILDQAGAFLKKRYVRVLDDIESHYSIETNGNNSRNVWICWLPGMEKAPKLVQVCYKSVQQHLQDREVVLLTERNIGQYVSLPGFIEKK